MSLIRKILIANRGEIACRITRTCHEMGIAVAAVYSDADANALHVEMADEAIYIGASPASESYLNGEKIIAAAQRTGADAIHPGFGFLAENAAFAQAVIDAGLCFIGPSPASIEAMGSKRGAKLLLKNVPVVPGYSGSDQSDEALITAANTIGFPIMVKASAGGGGKGMRMVKSSEVVAEALSAARREALQAFGDETLILEKLVVQPRHIEVQIFGDTHGNVIALGERECTIQRRHQKIIEETPSSVLTHALRAQILDTAVNIGKQLDYYSAGTVEFLLDADNKFYFMEMNTRLQVEHPVTELVMDIDLVRWQILIAEGHPLPKTGITPHGHAIEVRVYAEDPANNFLPVTGHILRWKAPSQVRVEAGIRSGDEISIHYDPMIGKIIAYADHREGAIRRLDYALAELQLLGLRSNIAFLRRVLMHPDHLEGRITTAFIEEHPELLTDDRALPPTALIAAAVARQPSSTFWRNNPNRPLRDQFMFEGQDYVVLLTPYKKSRYYTAQIGEQQYSVWVDFYTDTEMILVVDGHKQPVTVVCGKQDDWWVHTANGVYMLRWVSPLPLPGTKERAEGSLRAPMPGKIVTIMVELGQQVEKGALLLTLEAMKMEHRLQSPYTGTVTAIRYQPGDSVQAEEILLELAPLNISH